MKGVQAKDLRGNEPEELKRTLGKLQNDLFQHRLKRSTNQLENTMLIRNTRRDIARVNTVLAERVRASGGAAAAPVSGSGEAPPTPSTTKSKRTSKKPEAQAKTEET